MNKNRFIITFITVIATLIAVPPGAYAGQALSRDEIKTLLTDKTAIVHHESRDYDFKTYFGPDGKAITVRKGNRSEGTWKVDIDGYHCVNWGDGDRCATIEANGDGTYKRINNDGKHGVTYKKIVNGQDL